MSRALGVAACMVVSACAMGAGHPTTKHPTHEDELRRGAARTLAEHLGEVFRDRYAPGELKARTLGWRLPHQLATLRAVVEREPVASRSELQRAFRSFFQSLHDLHTSITFAEGRAVWLGIHAVTTEEGVRLAWIDPKLATQTPLRVGDEITAFDGRPCSQVVRGIAEADGYRSTPELEQAFADWFLGFRSTTELSEVPAVGSRARLEVRRAGARFRVELPWRDLDNDGPLVRPPWWPKARRSVLPPLGDLAWQAPDTSTFEAYAFEARARRYGFIRLHTYDIPAAEQGTAIHDFDTAIDEFIARGVDGIVIDQRGNGGGNYLLAYVMLTRLFDRPLVPTKQRYLVHGDEIVGLGPRRELGRWAALLRRPRTDPEARAALDRTPLVATYFGFGPRDLTTAGHVSSFFGFLEAQEAEGLTMPEAVFVPEFRPDATRGPTFTKPVVMLIDGMAVSAADYVPASLQDNGRATLFGTTTSGAGGDQRHVGLGDVCTPKVEHPLRASCAPQAVLRALEVLGFNGFNYTVTLGVRPGDRVIENVGAEPDVAYRIRAEDLTTGFTPMRELLLDTLQGPPSLRARTW